MKMKFLFLCGSVMTMAACGGGASSEGQLAGAAQTKAPVAFADTLDMSAVGLRAGASDTIAMGRIQGGEIVHEDLLIRNVDTQPFVILSVQTNCGCTQVEFPKTPIQPGAAAPFSFEFNSKGFNGAQFKHITITTSLDPKPYTLVATAEVL